MASDNDRDRSRGPSVAPRPGMRRRRTDGSRLAEAKSMDRVATIASSMFIIGNEKKRGEPRTSMSSERPPGLNGKPLLSRQATLGRNSQFKNLTSEDRDTLGGIEYRSLKLLLKIIVCRSSPVQVFPKISNVFSLLCGTASPRCYLSGTMDQARRPQVQRLPSRMRRRRSLVVRFMSSSHIWALLTYPSGASTQLRPWWTTLASP